MQIKELIQFIDGQEFVEAAKPKVKQDASGNWVDAETGEPVNAVPFGAQGQEQPKAQQEPAPQAQPEPAQNQASAQPAASTTGDPTLDKPLPPKEPKDPNEPGYATKFGRGVGQFAKGIGAVAGGVAGMGRAIKKGFQAGADTVGGPGAAPAGAKAKSMNKFAGGGAQSGGSAAQGGGAANVEKELDDLRQMINRIDAKLVKNNIKERSEKR